MNSAKWRDIVASDGEFDIYRYQSCIFSLVVGGALLTAGITALASFSIPDTFLGILGLSQVVYIAGKLVAPPSVADLNRATTTLRDLERKFRIAAAAKPDPSPPPGAQPTDPPADAAAARRRAKAEYDDYKQAVKSVRIGFESVTGRAVATANLEPSFQT